MSLIWQCIYCTFPFLDADLKKKREMILISLSICWISSSVILSIDWPVLLYNLYLHVVQPTSVYLDMTRHEFFFDSNRTKKFITKSCNNRWVNVITQNLLCSCSQQKVELCLASIVHITIANVLAIHLEVVLYFNNCTCTFCTMYIQMSVTHVSSYN